ncbi:hypothetical protein [uncultured Alistipes sp.]|jgi:lipoprotein|uniref:hypothetical protein n=1 Tax=uncultured Alistipes sp. TaxID=538949 RepID=UPI0025EEF2B2|nr:hypothetical protein [uncultured Alistipes sp.]
MKKLSFVRLLFTSLVITGLIGCSKTKDESKRVCEADCSVVTGTILTDGNQPVSGVSLDVTYEKTGFLYYNATVKARAKTDQSGHYQMRFTLKDSELTEEEGYFKLFYLRVEMKGLNTEKYILPADLMGVTEDVPTSTRNTVRCQRNVSVDLDFYIPQKRYIPVVLKGFAPVQENDYFEVQTYFPWGFEQEGEKMLDTKYGVASSGFNKFRASQTEQTFLNVPFALNENNILRIMKMKDGVVTFEDHPIYVTATSPEVLTYVY